MSSGLVPQLTQLASEARNRRIHTPDIIKELTIVMGYGHLVEMAPPAADHLKILQIHLKTLADLSHQHGYFELSQKSLQILKDVNRSSSELLPAA